MSQTDLVGIYRIKHSNNAVLQDGKRMIISKGQNPTELVIHHEGLTASGRFNPGKQTVTAEFERGNSSFFLEATLIDLEKAGVRALHGTVFQIRQGRIEQTPGAGVFGAEEEPDDGEP